MRTIIGAAALVTAALIVMLGVASAEHVDDFDAHYCDAAVLFDGTDPLVYVLLRPGAGMTTENRPRFATIAVRIFPSSDTVYGGDTYRHSTYYRDGQTLAQWAVRRASDVNVRLQCHYEWKGAAGWQRNDGLGVTASAGS